MGGALTRLEQAVEECVSAPLFALSSADLLSCMDRVQVLAQRRAAVELAVVREVDARALAVEDGATSTGSWLRFRWRCSPGAGSRLVKLASTVDSVLPQAGAALAAGRVNVEQVQVIGELGAASSMWRPKVWRWPAPQCTRHQRAPQRCGRRSDIDGCARRSIPAASRAATAGRALSYGRAGVS